MGDLRALERQRAWTELVAHLTDIPPSARDEAWQHLADVASVEIVTARPSAEEGSDALATANDLLKRFPSLATSKGFMSKRADAALAAAESCYHAGGQTSRCTNMLASFVKSDAANGDLAFQAGQLVVRFQPGRDAVAFFKQAVAAGRSSLQDCDDEAVLRAMADGLTMPEKDPQHVDAAAIRGACRATRRSK
jgi:hypothetical protein